MAKNYKHQNTSNIIKSVMLTSAVLSAGTLLSKENVHASNVPTQTQNVTPNNQNNNINTKQVSLTKQSQINAIKQAIANDQSQINNDQQQVNEKKQNYETAQTNKHQAQQTATAASNSLSNAQATSQQHQAEIASQTQKINEDKQQINAAQQNVTNDQNQVSNDQNQIKQDQAQVANAQNNVNAQTQKLNDAQQQAAGSHQAEANQLENQISSIQSQQKQVQTTQANDQNTVEQQQAQLNRDQAALSNAQSTLNQAQDKLKDLQEDANQNPVTNIENAHKQAQQNWGKGQILLDNNFKQAWQQMHNDFDQNGTQLGSDGVTNFGNVTQQESPSQYQLNSYNSANPISVGYVPSSNAADQVANITINNDGTFSVNGDRQAGAQVQQRLTDYAAGLINQVRQQLGMPPVKVSPVAIQYATQNVAGYNQDNHDMYYQGHDYDRLYDPMSGNKGKNNLVSKLHGISEIADEWIDGDSVKDGFINDRSQADENDAFDHTKPLSYETLQQNVFDSLKNMLYNDQNKDPKENEAHAEVITDADNFTNDSEMGLAIDKYGWIHMDFYTGFSDDNSPVKQNAQTIDALPLNPNAAKTDQKLVQVMNANGQATSNVSPAQIQAQQAAVQQAQNQVNQLTQAVKQDQTSLQNAQNKVSQDQTQLNTLNNQLQQVQNQLNALTADTPAVINAKHALVNAQSQLQNAQNKLKNDQIKLANDQAQLQNANQTLQNVQNNLANAQLQLNHYKQEAQADPAKVTAATQTLSNAQQTLTQMQDDLTNATHDYQAALNQLRKDQNQLRIDQEKLAALTGHVVKPIKITKPVTSANASSQTVTNNIDKHDENVQPATSGAVKPNTLKQSTANVSTQPTKVVEPSASTTSQSVATTQASNTKSTSKVNNNHNIIHFTSEAPLQNSYRSARKDDHKVSSLPQMGDQQTKGGILAGIMSVLTGFGLLGALHKKHH